MAAVHRRIYFFTEHSTDIQYSSIITSKRGTCTRMETRHKDILFMSRVCVDHVSRSV